MVTPVARVLVFLSGFAALLYQVVWQRILAILAGTDIYPITLVVAAFMAGLGIGHFAGGTIADRVPRRIALWLFAIGEMLIGLFAWFSAALYYDGLFEHVRLLNLPLGLVAVLIFMALLVPTVLMGAVLPLLARATTLRVEHAHATIGALYGVNTLGAAAGALVTTWVILPIAGFEGSLSAGAMLSAGAGVAAALAAASARWLSADAETAHRMDASLPGVASGVGRRWIAVFALTGFVALSLEIAWFRLFAVALRSSAPFTFSGILAVYLTGLGLGTLVGIPVAARSTQPGRLFLRLQAAAGLWVGLGVAAFAIWAEPLGRLRGGFGEGEPLYQTVRALDQAFLHEAALPADVPWRFLGVFVVLPILTILPVTFLMGCAFPVLQRVVQDDLRHVCRRLGTLLFANVAGATIGAFCTGWLLLGALGTPGTLSALSMLMLGVAATVMRTPSGWRASSWTPLGIAGLLLLLLAVFAGKGMETRLWAGLHETTAGRMIADEDATGLSVITADHESFAGRKMVMVDGKGHSELPYGDVHTALGALPALLHPNPRHVAIIGLGSGGTAYAAGARPETERVTVVEIKARQLPTLEALADRDPYPALHAFLRDPRVEHVRGGGRRFLRLAPRAFDIIEADALHPRSSQAGNLYSVEFFSRVRSRLRPGGLAVTWEATGRVRRTFVRVFPYVVGFGVILVGSDSPIETDAIAARIADRRIVDYYRRAGINITTLMTGNLGTITGRWGPAFDRSGLVDVNTDLFPRDELELRP